MSLQAYTELLKLHQFAKPQIEGHVDKHSLADFAQIKELWEETLSVIDSLLNVLV